MPPATIVAGRYRLLELLGQGGMGAVWRAHDQTLDREVAVKEVILPSDLSEEVRQVYYERTQREARSAARLDHPGIVTVHDVVQEDGRPWIVMRLIKARPLNELINESGGLPPHQVADIGAQLLDALAAAHAAGVLHRDVKPSNVLLDGRRAILTDFGIARLVGESTITATEAVIGTPSYLAPERALRQEASPASDLWSLGATLYAAVEGRPPYQRPDVWGIMAALLAEEPDPPLRAGSLTPVLAGLLRRDPAQRLTAVQAAPMMAAVVATPTAPLPLSMLPPPAPSLAPAPTNPITPRQGSSHKWLILSGTLLALGVVAAVTIAATTALTGSGAGHGTASSGSTSSTDTSVPTGSGPTGPVPAPTAGYRTYKGQDFTANVPSSWTTSSSMATSVSFTGGQSATSMTITRLAPGVRGEVRTMMDSTMRQLKGNTSMGSQIKVESGPKDIAYFDGASEVQYTMGSPFAIRTLMRMFVARGTIYEIMLLGPVPVWDNAQAAWKTFVDSLRITA